MIFRENDSFFLSKRRSRRGLRDIGRLGRPLRGGFDKVRRLGSRLLRRGRNWLRRRGRARGRDATHGGGYFVAQESHGHSHGGGGGGGGGGYYGQQDDFTNGLFGFRVRVRVVDNQVRTLT